MRGRILIVEDEPGIAESLSGIFQDEGYEAVSTPSGANGLLQAGREHFDAALIDMDVEELSGLGVARVLADLGGVAAICMSARSQGWQKECFENGATACFCKPFPIDPVVDLVDALLQAERRGPELPGDVRALSGEDLLRIAGLTDGERDELPFGLVRVDDEGIIRGFNSFEAAAAGNDPTSVIGTRFFDLAPCTEIKAFTDAAFTGLHQDRIDRVLRFFFPHHGGTCVVSVRLWRDPLYRETWIFISKRRGEVSRRLLDEPHIFA